MRRRNGSMSAAGIGLLLLVGGSSLVLYALVAQHLSPPATLDRPHVRGMAATSPTTRRQDGAGQSSPSPVIPRDPGSNTRPTAIASAVPAGPLTVAVLFTLATHTPAVPDPSGGRAPSTPAPSPVPTTPLPVPSSVPPTLPSPGAPEPLPTTPPAKGEPPVRAAGASNGCGHSRGHRIHLPVGTSNPTAANARGHVLHPCKSKGHGNVPDAKTDSERHTSSPSRSGDDRAARHEQAEKKGRSHRPAGRSNRNRKVDRQGTSGHSDTEGKGHARTRHGKSHAADRPDGRRVDKRSGHHSDHGSGSSSPHG
jgi:hypothetical protein